MPVFDAYQSLPFFDQLLHGAHFMICSFAVLIGCAPLLTEKGTPEHKFTGLVYLPVSIAGLLLASWMAWRESSLVLFTFNIFCLYLLLSGWRAVHEAEKPSMIDWLIPFSLFSIVISVTTHALLYDNGMRSFYLLFFALNGLYLCLRDWKHLKRRVHQNQHKVFFTGTHFGAPHAAEWMGRHIAGMVGSMTASLSVVVLTLLPIELHWLWPVSLLMIGAYIAHKERQKKQRVRNILLPIMEGKFRSKPPFHKNDDDIRKAA